MAANDWTQADVTQCVDQVLQSRRSVRAYRPDPLAGDRVLEVLQAASCAPSNSNTQPWRVHVVTGAALRQLGDALVAAFRHGDFPPPAHFPDPLPGEFQERQAEFAARYYGALGIPRRRHAGPAGADRAQLPLLRRARRPALHHRRPPDAPQLAGPRPVRAERHAGSRSRGLDTCPQVSFARYHAVIASHLAFMEHELTVCGMSLGYPDRDVPVNQVATPRRAVHEFVSFQRFADP
jgi:nitroreductase